MTTRDELTRAGPAAPVSRQSGFRRLLVLFLFSGAAALIYELVWFQLLRLTIGGSAQSLGVLLACFMGGLCAGSLLYARFVPASWHPLKTYALIELGIAACGLALPVLLGQVSGLYFASAQSPTAALVWRSLMCFAALTPPTLLMGATLPALARWVNPDARQTSRIGRLYAANIAGAVIGVFGAALVLLPALGLMSTNLVAVLLNGLAAVIALSIREPRRPIPAPAAVRPIESNPQALTCIAYAVSGMAALSFEVVWARLMGTILGATVYGFALVLGVFLLGLASGGAIGSALVPRLRSARSAFAQLQLAVVATAGLTPWIVPGAANLLVQNDMVSLNDPLALTLSNLVRSMIVVFPGALAWGMLFPVAVAGFGGSLADPAPPVGRLYAWNTIGAAAGSLLTSFVLIPRIGTSMGTAHLVLLPLAAAVVILWPRRLAPWTALGFAGMVAAIVFATDWPRRLCQWGIENSGWLKADFTYLLLAALPAFLGFELFLVKRQPGRLLAGAAVSALIFAFTTRVPPRLYELGRGYGESNVVGGQEGEIVFFEEGAMEPVVVSRTAAGPLQLSINSIVCASTVPDAMEHLRLLGHLPALLSEDPGDALVIGLGAGVTAGCVAIHDRVERVQVIELEPKVKQAAALFGETNHHVMDNPRVNVRIDDGRHFLATTQRRFGVITSDPIEPFWAGSAALYTIEHFRRCRERLVEGGIFCQWLGLFGLDEPGVRSLLAAFAGAFPDGAVWATPSEMIFLGSTGPMRYDIPALRARLAADRDVADSLAFVGVRSVEELFGRYVCPVSALADYIRDAEPNRDRMLTVQYTGWRSFYQSRRWNEAIRDALAGHRRLERTEFHLPPQDLDRFFRRLEEEWLEFLEPSRWPGAAPADPQATSAPGGEGTKQ